jgi:hypothetical protein
MEMLLQTKAMQSSKSPAAKLKAVTRSTAKLEFSYPASILSTSGPAEQKAWRVTGDGDRSSASRSALQRK